MFNKSIYFIIFFFSLFIVLNLTKSYFLTDYYKIEQDKNNQKISNFVNSLEESIDSIYSITDDYAKWDDTYDFLKDRNKDYINDNFRDNTNTVRDLKFNFMIYSSLDNETIFSTYYNFTNSNKKEFEKKVFQNLKDDTAKTIISDGKAAYLIVKTQVSTSDSEAKSNGYLYSGKLIDNEYLKNITTNFDFISISKKALSKELKSNKNEFKSKYFNLAYFKNFDANHIRNNICLVNKDGMIILNLETKDSMNIVNQGKKTVMLFSYIVTVFIAIIFFISFNQNKKLKRKVKEKTRELEKSLKKLKSKNEKIAKTTEMLNNSQRIAHVGSYDFNIKTDELVWSDEHYRIAKKEKKNFSPVAKDYFDLVHFEDRDYVQDMLQKTIMNNETNIFRYRLLLDDKTIKYVQSTSGISIRDEDGNPLILSGVIFDISDLIEKEEDLKSKEALLIEQSKMAVMGEMIGNISHQLKQPLNLISTIASSIKINKTLNTLDESTLINSMDEITNNSKHLSSTIDDFRDFFSPNKKVRNINMNNLFNRALKLINTELNLNSISIVSNIEDVDIYTYDNELLQVLLNIFNNAKDEFVSKKQASKRIIFIEAYTQNDKVIISIKDNAGGVPQEIISKIFDAYFTTKCEGKGTGIGLYMSKQIINKNLKGEILIKNEEYEYEGTLYKGANFILKI